MVYVKRDENGRLLRVEREPFAGAEPMNADAPEVLAWMNGALDARLQSLQRSDLELVRVLEDLVGVLVNRGLIRYTDLPEAARRKLEARATTRASLDGLGGLVEEEDERLF
ncbi:tryptophan synthase subunit beta [Pseudomonas citronellolis]|uniref:tryptophan synthase subunit beta n=1 Tax=Pseudomonas citronellolis TaxID=53408 RepID=UPI0023E35252|nr:tryptophan synthase subunit beta [Pseudomonas citronellolis]MDF3934260.1 tryptophan synthase subunit beta [Pseudomonas citronellolis]